MTTFCEFPCFINNNEQKLSFVIDSGYLDFAQIKAIKLPHLEPEQTFSIQVLFETQIVLDVTWEFISAFVNNPKPSHEHQNYDIFEFPHKLFFSSDLRIGKLIWNGSKVNVQVTFKQAISSAQFSTLYAAMSVYDLPVIRNEWYDLYKEFQMVPILHNGNNELCIPSIPLHGLFLDVENICRMQIMVNGTCIHDLSADALLLQPKYKNLIWLSFDFLSNYDSWNIADAYRLVRFDNIRLKFEKKVSGCVYFLKIRELTYSS